MKSRRLSRTSRPARRGHTLAEVLVAASIALIGMAGLGTALNSAGRMDQQVTLQTDADQAAALAMQRMVIDVREASEVQVPAANRFRIYYPILRADGHYDRFRTDYTVWVEYAQTNASGTPSATGTYLWRSTNGSAGRAVTQDITRLEAVSSTDDSVRLSLAVAKNAGRYSGSSQLDQRVIYLRNH